MARVLTLRYKDVEIPVILKTFSRDDLYGKSIVEKRGEDGTVYQQANLTLDGTQILPYKGIGANYIDINGTYLSKTLLVDSEDKAIPITRSIYKEPVKLSKTISIDDYFGYVIERTYILTSEQTSDLNRLYSVCEKLLEQGKLYRFTYAYYDTATPRDAILLPKNEVLYVAIGEYAEPIMVSPSEILYSDIEEELEEEIAFEIW
ncbi:MAG: hypothetical protein ACFFB5_24540 [Promethearchaeota archaeon]